MKIRHIYNAACVYESAGYKILCDPWLYDGAFEGAWFHYPTLKSKPCDFFDVNAIYLSHLHPDHFDEKALAEFPRHIPIIYLFQEPNFLQKKIKELGFTNLHPLIHNEWKRFGPFCLTMYKPFCGNLFHESALGNLIDSAIVIECDTFRVMNGNDNCLTLDASKWLRNKHGPFDVVQLVDSCAGPYPACFTNLSHEEKISEKNKILDRHLNLTLECAKALEAKFFQPFAGHYKLGGKLIHLNQYLAVHEPEEVAAKASAFGLNPLLLRENDVFDLESRLITPAKPFTQSVQEWECIASQAKFPYEDMPELPLTEFAELFQWALARLRKKQLQLNCWPEWKVNINDMFMFDLRPGEPSENIISFKMDRRLLAAILQKKIHFNNAEVGCHIEMDRNPNKYDPDVHTLMCFFHA